MFKNYDDTVLECLKPHVERLVGDTAHDTHETSQRCAAEIIAGLVRGSKHWSYDKVSPTRDRKLSWPGWLVGLIRGSKHWSYDKVSPTWDRKLSWPGWLAGLVHDSKHWSYDKVSSTRDRKLSWPG